MIKNIATLIFSLILISCSPIAHLKVVPDSALAIKNNAVDGQSKIFLIRGESTNAAPFPLSVYLDGSFVGTLDRYDYITINASPGNHKLKTDCNFPCGFKFEYEIILEKNSNYFYETYVGAAVVPVGVSVTKGLLQINQSKARAYLNKYGFKNPEI